MTPDQARRLALYQTGRQSVPTFVLALVFFE